MKTTSRINLPLSSIAAIIATVLPAAMLMLGAQTSLAGSASWLPSPPTNNWNTAGNWTAGGPPNGSADTATFASSNVTGVSLSQDTEVNGIVFNAGASAFTISTPGPALLLTISGVGITNNSGIIQSFITAAPATPPHASIVFTNSATAGNLTAFTISGGDVSGQFGGFLQFYNSSTAGSGTFITNGGEVGGARGGFLQFNDTSTAGNAMITINGTAVMGALRGHFDIANTSTAGNATLIANSGPGSATDLVGGIIRFFDDSTGGTARIEVFGNGIAGDTTNGNLDISFHNAPGMATGSIEGSGAVFLGSFNLTVGGNNLSTIFSGTIQSGGQNGGTGGSLTKIGSGTLTFQGGASNDHIADTVSLSIASGSTINLNFTGTPDTVRSLVVGGVAQVPGLYGGPASGAPHQFPQFTGTGEILVTTLATTRAGGFDVSLPLSGTPGIECRSGGANTVYQVVVNFLNAVTFNSASVSAGTGMVTSATGSGTTAVTVNLAGVTNAQTITVTLFGVNDGSGANDISIPMSILVGDTSGNGTVNASDVSQTKAQAGQPITASNFREDVTGNGVINASDVSLVKSKTGTALP